MRFALSFVLLLCASAVDAQTAQFIRLGHLPGPYPSSDAAGVSANGEVVTGTSRSHVGYWGEAYRWDAQTGMAGLGLLPGHNQSHAAAISPDGGWVVGYGVQSPEHWEAFAWSADTGMFGLGDLPGGQHKSTARGASRNGRVIVGRATVDAAGWDSETSEAFMWTPQDGMIGLGTISPSGMKPSSGANGVSADGRVIVGNSTSQEGNQAFRWTAEEGMVGLGAMDADRFASGADAVSDNGLWTVGTSTTAIDNGGGHATQGVLWTPDGEIIGLGWPAGAEYSNTWVTDVSDDGGVVVGRVAGAGNAFLWTPDEGMRLLHEVLLDDYGLDVFAMGWRLDYVNALTPDGLTLVGTGLSPDGYGEPWMIRLPAPGSLAPLAGAALLAVRRRR